MKIVTLNHIKAENAEIIGALLSQINQEGWEEQEDNFQVYFNEEAWGTSEVQEAINSISKDYNLSLEVNDMENINWNEKWESDYEPVYIDDLVYIKSTFHPQKDFPYTIVIQPKMSFGTGHHATTKLMCMLVMELDVKNKSVVDIGTGTGILALLAKMRGADYVLATDYDIWCYENTLENIELNNIKGIEVQQSDTLDTITQQFDVIIANIHKNYQLENLQGMYNLLNEKGFLLISGFYENDSKELLNLANSIGLIAHSIKVENNWCAICLYKN